VSASVAFWVLRGPVRGLITRTVGLEPATQFYERMLFLGLLYIAIAVVFGAGDSDLGKDPTFMGVVFRMTAELDMMLGYLVGFLALFMIMITIIIAAHRRTNDQ
jgi:hypothetical protein